MVASGSQDGTIKLWRILKPNSIENEELAIAFSVFPNSAEEYIEIKDARAEHALPLQDIKIYNMLGECVMSAGGAGGTHPFVPSQEGNIRINVSCLPSGVYFVRVGDWVGRFLKI